MPGRGLRVPAQALPPRRGPVQLGQASSLAAPSILADGGAPAPERRSRKRAIAMVAAAALVLGVGAGACAVGAALSGGGAQPESVVPASAVFYAEVDLDPSAGQKVDAFRFLRKFPQLKDTFTADGGFGPGFAKLFDGSDVDYAKDIEPWLGKRYAVALVPGASKDQLRAEAVVQVTDEKAASASLTKPWSARPASRATSVVVRDGYAIIAVAVSPKTMATARRLRSGAADADLSRGAGREPRVLVGLHLGDRAVRLRCRDGVVGQRRLRQAREHADGRARRR